MIDSNKPWENQAVNQRKPWEQPQQPKQWPQQRPPPGYNPNIPMQSQHPMYGPPGQRPNINKKKLPSNKKRRLLRILLILLGIMVVSTALTGFYFYVNYVKT